MKVALLLLFILVIPRLRVALHQSYDIDETGQLDLNAIYTLGQSPHSCSNGVGLDSVGSRRGRLGLAQGSTGMGLLFELVALQVRILNHFGHSLNALLIITNSHPQLTKEQGDAVYYQSLSIVNGWCLMCVGGVKIIAFAEDEFLHPLSHQRICHIQQGNHSLTQSPEEIQKLTLPGDYTLEQTLTHIMAKGITVQMPFVRHFIYSFSPTSTRLSRAFFPSLAQRRPNSKAKTRASSPNLFWKWSRAAGHKRPPAKSSL
jgi:hypothetical protein